MSNFRSVARAALVCVLLAGAVAAASGAPGTDPGDLAGILNRFDEVQESIRTLSAEFTETTANPLLLEPIRSRGRFYMTKPDSIRWEYTEPEAMRFVIAHDLYTGYFPEQKRAERRNIQRWSDQIFRFFGLGQGSKELRRFYEISLAPANDVPGTHLLLLEPKKRRVRKRVDSVQFWLDAGSFLPTRVEYRSADGQVRTIRFDEIRLNPDLSASLYTVDIPSDVEVTSGFSGLPDFEPSTTQ